jgi:hypothetical protein
MTSQSSGLAEFKRSRWAVLDFRVFCYQMRSLSGLREGRLIIGRRRGLAGFVEGSEEGRGEDGVEMGWGDVVGNQVWLLVSCA